MKHISTKLSVVLLGWLALCGVAAWAGVQGADGALVGVAVLAAALVPVLLWMKSMLVKERNYILEEQRRELKRTVAAVQQNTLHDYWQMEALLNVLTTLRPERPLPYTRKWAASPDLLRHVMNVVLDERPSVVVEASSGTSTVLIAHLLKRAGAGMVIALEHDAAYAEQTRKNLRAHGLEAWAEVVHAPLVEHQLDGRTWKWYDLRDLHLPGPIDLVVIDGPPENIQSMARYPAVPLLERWFGKRTTVVLDDGGRPDETAIAERWAKEFKAAEHTYLYLEKGGWQLRFDR
ncbi:MAG: class I SAM-dependent methyltransferase [Flavobacteriales bacterium]|jgi:hypothetical protein|nr:class I SAM-dependent methyltransferase [Flavobacteriales bacterium]